MRESVPSVPGVATHGFSRARGEGALVPRPREARFGMGGMTDHKSPSGRNQAALTMRDPKTISLPPHPGGKRARGFLGAVEGAPEDRSDTPLVMRGQLKARRAVGTRSITTCRYPPAVPWPTATTT